MRLWGRGEAKRERKSSWLGSALQVTPSGLGVGSWCWGLGWTQANLHRGTGWMGSCPPEGQAGTHQQGFWTEQGPGPLA